uniref:Uncharacterized protein n=1 Tax=Aegilops tauschii subsp. strangulata TaxID=200361 RepID=A0A453JJA5_AEGTS
RGTSHAAPLSSSSSLPFLSQRTPAKLSVANVIEAKEVSQRNSPGDGDPDLLSRFTAAMGEDDGGGKLPTVFHMPEAKRRFPRDVVVSFILAGEYTTTSGLTWFFWILAANPRCEQPVHYEVSRSPDGNV